MLAGDINGQLEYLHKVISGAMDGCVDTNPITDRLLHLSIISLFTQVNGALDELNKELDLSIKIEGVSIDFDTFLDEKYWTNNYLFDNEENFYKAVGFDIYNTSFNPMINDIVDCMPNEVEGFHIKPEYIDTFRTSMHQLCDRNKLGGREIQFMLLFNLKRMLMLLEQIKEKVEHPQKHRYRQVWDEVYEEYNDKTCKQSYITWREDNEGFTLDALKKRQLIEIYELLTSGFFRFFDEITGSDVKNRKLIITEDDLPVGYKVSDELHVECTRFENFFEWKEKVILSLKYDKLGQYIYRHYNQMHYKDIPNIVTFDKTLDAIHKDMAKLNPSLAKYLKDYDHTVLEELIKQCSEILNTCQQHLKEGIRNTFLREYLSKLLYESEIKQEAKEKLLSKKFRNKYLCHIIAALNCFFVFKVEVIKADLARSLSSKFTRTNSESALENIERFERERKGPLYEWTKKIIDDLKDNPYNPFMGLSTKSS